MADKNIDIILEEVGGKDAPEKDSPREFSREDWKEIKHRERNEVYALIDDTAGKIAGDPELFGKWITCQARFDRLSVNNTLLIAAQNPEATNLKDFKSWKELGVYIKSGEKGIYQLEPGSEFIRADGTVGTNFNVKRMFDISQTTGLQPAERKVRYDTEVLVAALLTDPPCEIEMDRHGVLLVPAGYNRGEDKIYLKPGSGSDEAFRYLATALITANETRYNKRCREPDEIAFTATWAAEIVCVRNGLERSELGTEMPERFRALDVKGIKNELAAIRNSANRISDNMNRYIERTQLKPRDKAPEPGKPPAGGERG